MRSNLSILLCAGLLPRLGQEPANVLGFKGWIQHGEYSPRKSTTEESVVILDRVRLADIIPYINHDYERFALSCRETNFVFNLEKTHHNLIGWPLLKSYYASFFSAHSVMRSRGAGVSRIGREEIRRLNLLLKIFDHGAEEMSGGTYFYQIIPSVQFADEVSINISVAPQGSGVHESFWILFSDFLNRQAEKAVLQGSPDASTFVAEVKSLSDTIKLGGQSGGAWLSSVRNELNYQHAYEAWFPTKRNAECAKALDPMPKSDTAHLNNSKKKSPIHTFLNTTLFITGLGINVGDYVAARSTAGGAFGQKWRRLGHHFPPQ